MCDYLGLGGWKTNGTVPFYRSMFYRYLIFDKVAKNILERTSISDTGKIGIYVQKTETRPCFITLFEGGRKNDVGSIQENTYFRE